MSHGSGRGPPLSLDDCLCPVCLEIFVEPVTLPCTHTFCKECFLQGVDMASLLCPLCRRRISVWCRQNSRNNTLINQKLWTNIQNTFPLQCERRRRTREGVEPDHHGGLDNLEDDLGVSVCVPRVSEPGELRQEYEEQVSKLTEERRALEEEERRASEELIQRLLAQEEEELQEETKRREEDERLARLLSSQLNSDAPQGDPRPADTTPAKKKKKEVCPGQIEKFLSLWPALNSSSANKENILHKRDPHRDGPALPSPPLATLPSSTVEKLLPPSLRGPMTTEGGASCIKRKSWEPETQEDEEVTVTKRACVSTPSSGPVGVVEWEAELMSRRQQEEEDRRLAVLLQKELDQEERLRASDRRKGSTDAYPLRQDCRGKEGVELKTRKPPASTVSSLSTLSSCSSSSSSSSAPSARNTNSSSSSRGIKQKTLTEMFSSINN